MVMTSSNRICLPSWEALVSPLTGSLPLWTIVCPSCGAFQVVKEAFFTSLHFGKADNGHAIDKCRQ